MQWFTPIALPAYPFTIGLNKPMLAVGSCFANTIGKALHDRCFPITVNPAGILFNPASIHRLFRRMVEEEWVTTDELWQQDGLWHHWDFHGSFSHPEATAAAAAMNESLLAGRQALQNGQALLLTLGTAHVWELADTGQIVANNHKQPHQQFRHRLLRVEEVHQMLQDILQMVHRLQPSLPVLITVSPVRHLRDGAIANNRSKAHLLAAVHQIVDGGRAHYFPAYELMLDELRDYRFYAGDHAHPSSEAEQHIWDRFHEALLTPTAKAYCHEVDALLRDLAHRPLFPQTDSWRQFVARGKEKTRQLQLAYPDMPIGRLAAAWENQPD